MKLWDLFQRFQTETTIEEARVHAIEKKVRTLFPNSPDDEIIEVSAISGLLARVAYCDLEIHVNEKDSMVNSLQKWTKFEKSKAKSIVDLAILKIKELASVENHIYTQILSEIMDEEQRYELLKTLFNLAAADGNVESVESEEIRVISKGLLLDHQHYIAARASVLKYLGTLK